MNIIIEFPTLDDLATRLDWEIDRLVGLTLDEAHEVWSNPIPWPGDTRSPHSPNYGNEEPCFLFSFLAKDDCSRFGCGCVSQVHNLPSDYSTFSDNLTDQIRSDSSIPDPELDWSHNEDYVTRSHLERFRHWQLEAHALRLESLDNA